MSTRALAALAMVASLATAAAHAQSSRELFDQLVPPELALAHADELGLSASQRQAVQRIHAELGSRAPALLRQVREEQDALVALLRQENPDEVAVLARFDALDAAESELKRLRLQMTVRTKRVLTSEQQARALALQERRVAAGAPAEGGETVRARLQRVKDGLERWKREGRDVTPLRELWERFQEAEAKGHYRQARQALDEAIALLEAPPPER